MILVSDAIGLVRISSSWNVLEPSVIRALLGEGRADWRGILVDSVLPFRKRRGLPWNYHETQIRIPADKVQP